MKIIIINLLIKYKIIFIKKLLKECYNLILMIDIIFNKLIKIYMILKINNNLKKNLIFQQEYNQDKELLELLKDVKVKLIINIMQ